MSIQTSYTRSKQSPVREFKRSIFVATVLTIGAIVTTTGCGKQTPARNRPPTREELAAKAQKEIPGTVTGSGWNIKWTSRSNTADGHFEQVLLAKASEGTIRDPHSPTVNLQNVTARLYHDGKHAATVVAPYASANQTDRNLIATGGVTVTSITDPPDTVITADKMTWNDARNLLIAEGHAQATMSTPGQARRSTTGDRLYFDTKLKEIRNE